LPTVAESGVPGFEAVSLHGVFLPVKTPQAIAALVNQDIVRVLQRPESKERLATIGVDPVGTTPAQFSTLIKEEVERMGKVIREAGIEEK
jgi:tripartite-type tricarboxylate transporter receptor subunit TctC